MDVPLALLADAANYSRENKLNVLGVFSRISAESFPTIHPQMQLVVGFDAAPAEFDTEKDVTIVLLNADGAEQMRMSGRLNVPRAQPGERARWYQIIPLTNTVLVEPGDYALAVMVGGETKAEVKLVAALTSSEEGVNGHRSIEQ